MLREAGAEHGKALIVNTASIAGKTGQAWLSVYSATKAAVIGFSQATQKEVASEGIQVTALARAFVDTPMTEFVKGAGEAGGDDPPRGHRRVGSIPARDVARLPGAGDRLHAARTSSWAARATAGASLLGELLLGGGEQVRYSS